MLLKFIEYLYSDVVTLSEAEELNFPHEQFVELKKIADDYSISRLSDICDLLINLDNQLESENTIDFLAPPPTLSADMLSLLSTNSGDILLETTAHSDL